MELDRGFVADRAVRPLLVVVATPSLAFSSRIVAAHELAWFTVPHAPQLPRRTLEAALSEGPATYLELMAALGTRDGREILRDFDKLYAQGRLKRLKDGRYTLNGGA
jgi:hypothetical protein